MLQSRCEISSAQFKISISQWTQRVIYLISGQGICPMYGIFLGFESDGNEGCRDKKSARCHLCKTVVKYIAAIQQT